MRSSAPAAVRSNPAKLVVAIWMLGLWIASSALSSSPQLHAWVHHEAGDPEHQCLATQLDQHPAWVGTPPTLAAPPSDPGVDHRHPDREILPPRSDHRLQPGRAPPREDSRPRVAG